MALTRLCWVLGRQTGAWAGMLKLLRRLCPAGLPAAPTLVFGHKLVCVGERSGGTCWGGQCLARSAAAWPVRGRRCSFKGRQKGFGGRNKHWGLSAGCDVAFCWRGHIRIENVRILVSASRGLAAFVCHGEYQLWEIWLQAESPERQ